MVFQLLTAKVSGAMRHKHYKSTTREYSRPYYYYYCNMQRAQELMEEIMQLYSVDHYAAEKKLHKLKALYSKSKDPYLQAHIKVYSVLIDDAFSRCKEDDFHDTKLLTYLEKNKLYREAAWLLSAAVRYYFRKGNIAQGEIIMNELREKFFDKLAQGTQVHYYSLAAYLHSEKNEYLQQLSVCLKAMDILETYTSRSVWWYSSYALFAYNIIAVYTANEEYDKASEYVQVALEIAAKKSLTIDAKSNIFVYAAHYYSAINDHENAMKWYKQSIDLIKTEDGYIIHLSSYYYLLSRQCFLLYRETPTSQKGKQTRLLKQMEDCAKESGILIDKEKVSTKYIRWLVNCARLELLKNNYPKTLQLLNEALHIVQKQNLNIQKHTLENYQLRHVAYYEWGVKTKDNKKLAIAYEFIKKELDIIQADAKKTIQKKMDALREHYELGQKKLNEKLLQHQIDGMNKELQMTNLNLHEKVMVLEELKAYIHSLKLKQLETRQLINTISKKIDSVKITEQDKAQLQQKMDGNHKHLSKLLSEKHPSLSPLEIRMCSLFQTGITNKELAKLYGQTEKAYEQHRYRIKKKMKLSAEESLSKYLLTLNEQR